MKTYDWSQVETLFDSLLDAPAEQRMEMLHGATDYPPEVVDEVKALLQGLGESGGFLETPPATAARAALQVLDEGERLGAWRVVRLIGAGGQGQVYEVTRDDGQFEQPGALKILSALGGPGPIRRFLRERQLLAELSHPSIPALIDGGIREGQPWLVTELVAGVRLDEWRLSDPGSIAARMAVLTQLCDAVAHAHSRLVIHRDIKPQNVLMEADLTPRLLDFGTARRVSSDASRTDSVFTLAYAAPEQVRDGVITPATDIYCLGAVGYFLLTGNPAFSAEDPAATVQKILDGRPEFDADVPADLQAIVAKAMRREPEERFATVDAFRRDLLAWRDGLPVSAVNGNTWYRLRKLVRRHAFAAAALTITTMAIVLGATIALYQAREARIARDEAVATATKYQTISSLWSSMFRAADPSRVGTEDVTAEDLLARASETVPEADVANDAKADLLNQIAGVHLNRGEFQQALDVAMLALPLADSVDGRAGHNLKGETHLLLGTAGKMVGNYGLARKHVTQARTILLEHLEQQPDTPNMLAYTTNMLGTIIRAQGLHREALKIHENNFRTVEDDNRVEPWLRHMVGNNLGDSLIDLERFEEAEALLQTLATKARNKSSLSIDERSSLGKNLQDLGDLAMARDAFGLAAERYAEAYSINVVAYAPDHPSTLRNELDRLGAELLDDSARPAQRLEEWRRNHTAAHPELDTRANWLLARVQCHRQQFQDCYQLTTRVLEDLPPSDRSGASLLGAFAAARSGATDAARKLGERALESMRPSLPESHTQVRMAEALVQQLQGDRPRIVELRHQLSERYGPGHTYHRHLETLTSMQSP